MLWPFYFVLFSGVVSPLGVGAGLKFDTLVEEFLKFWRPCPSKAAHFGDYDREEFWILAHLPPGALGGHPPCPALAVPLGFFMFDGVSDIKSWGMRVFLRDVHRIMTCFVAFLIALARTRVSVTYVHGTLNKEWSVYEMCYIHWKDICLIIRSSRWCRDYWSVYILSSLLWNRVWRSALKSL